MARQIIPIPPSTEQNQFISLVNRNFAELDRNFFDIVHEGTITIPAVAAASPGDTKSAQAYTDSGVGSPYPFSFLAYYESIIYVADLGEFFTSYSPLTSLSVSAGGIVQSQDTPFVFLRDGTVWFGVNRINFSETSDLAESTVKYYLLKESAS